MSAVTVRADGVRRVFPGDVVAVDGIDMAVDAGEVFGLLGPNGAGKTTTVRMLTALLRPTAGQVRVAGFDVVRQPWEVRRRIGVALQDTGLDELATGHELLVLHARLHGATARDARRGADELLELLGLTAAADRRVATYSGGMRRRLDLASALVHRPRVLFLDEPTTGLDPASRFALWDEIRRRNRDEGITVVLTTHYLDEADRLADRLAIIDGGRIVVEGTPTALKRSVAPDVVSVTVDACDVPDARRALGMLDGIADLRANDRRLTLFVDDGASLVPVVLRRLADAGVGVGAVTVAPATLDEVFLQATGARLEGRPTDREVAA